MVGHQLASAANDVSMADALARGWRVQLRPAGLLIHTCGQPSDPVLMDQLFAVMLRQESPRWPAAVLDDPGEVVLRGELELIEREINR
jgi:hypothetical protein